MVAAHVRDQHATALGDSLRQAQRAAYGAIGVLHFDGMQYRTDIGHRARARRG